MDRGEMTERLRIERPGEVEVPGGASRTVFSEVRTVWAKMVPLTGGEREEGEQREASIRYRIWMDNYRDLQPSDRLIWTSAGDQVLNIRELFDPGQRAIFRQMVAEEGVAS